MLRQCAAPRAHFATLAMLTAAAIPLSPSALAGAPEVLVVTDAQHPIVTAPGARVILLDTPNRLKSGLSAHLPADRELAAKLVRERLKSGGADLQHRFQRAYQDATEAWHLGVTHIPAVIVDRQFVIYGETNVEAAVSRIQTYRKAHP